MSELENAVYIGIDIAIGIRDKGCMGQRIDAIKVRAEHDRGVMARFASIHRMVKDNPEALSRTVMAHVYQSTGITNFHEIFGEILRQMLTTVTFP